MVDTEKIFKCPLCPMHKEPKLYVNIDKGVFNCFHCNFAGPISKLAKYPAIYSQIEDRESLAVFKRLAYKELKKKVFGSDLMKALKPFREIEESDDEYAYLISRGFDEDIIDCYDVFVSDNSRYQDRVFITINNDDGEPVFYTGRSILQGITPKYLNSMVDKDFVFKSKTPVDNFYTDNAYIGEGVFDMYKLPGGIALLGKTLAKDQHKSLFAALRSKKNIYTCLDPGTKRETMALVKELDSWFPSKSIYVLNWAENADIDLGDLSQKMSRIDLMSYVHDHSTLFVNSFFG